ncbi:MAG: trypsin-like peptidase domain-containing protein [Acidimicrobiia bacterium]|nr:trypsin-like peptidase domain-containing protein [Acidimicrobiia bacterium]
MSGRMKLAVVVLLVAGACSGGDAETIPPGTTASPPTTASTTTSTSTSVPPATITSTVDGRVGPDTESVAAATVQILQLDSSSGNLEPGCFSGSGTIISADGLILTNAHVVEVDQVCPYDTIGVAVLERTDQAPDLRYIADLLVLDPALDLAVIRIAADMDGAAVDVDLPFMALGDSQDVDLGDQLRVLGYPGIGGDTITLTSGTVSGFTEERDIDGRAWIKTDATISGGNSGGSAVDASGALVGVPTIAGSGANVDPTDCRVIQDTNGDGRLDDDDTCIPIGGFINGVRPINLAVPLIAEAETAVPISLDTTTTPTTIGPVLDAAFGPISFSTGVTANDEPINDVDFIPSGTAERVCGFWDYDGMADGLSFDAFWYLDQEFIEDASFIDSEWFGGATGNWWVCFISPEGPLADGVYELLLNIEGETASGEAIIIGGDHPPRTFEIVNDTGDDICFLLISLSEAQDWGSDELGETEVISAGASRIFEVPGAYYDIQAFDCSLNLVAEEFFLDLNDSQVYTVTG